MVTGMPRAALPSEGRADVVVLWIAAGVSFLFAVAHIVFSLLFVPAMLYAYRSTQVGLPLVLEYADALGPFGIAAGIGVLDVAVFVVFALAARRYWQGLLFVPPLLYLLAAFSLLIASLSGIGAVLAA